MAFDFRKPIPLHLIAPGHDIVLLTRKMIPQIVVAVNKKKPPVKNPTPQLITLYGRVLKNDPITRTLIVQPYSSPALGRISRDPTIGLSLDEFAYMFSYDDLRSVTVRLRPWEIYPSTAAGAFIMASVLIT